MGWGDPASSPGVREGRVSAGKGEQMATTTVKNGVDVDRLVQTIDAIGQDTAIGQFTFKARTDWKGGGTSSGQISSFTHAGQESAHASAHTLVGSEPAVLLGDDSGANAVELVLAALGFCYSVGFAYNAAARGIELEELSYEVEGDLDLRAFLGLGGGPRAGFTQIRVKGIVKARNADAATLEELCQYVQDTSPVRDILANATPVVTDLEVR
jgi:uncharacterized OsmC-like protein